MSSSTLFTLQTQNKVKIKSLGRTASGDPEYLLKIKSPQDNVTWFSNFPERSAGSGTIDELIEGWDQGFNGDQPNSALTYTDKEGNQDTIVFEQFKPKYNQKSDVMSSKIVIHEDQFLRKESRKNKSYFSELSRDAELGNGNHEFDRSFTGASLFIDDFFTLRTKAKITNKSNKKLLVQQLVSAPIDTPWGNLAMAGLGIAGMIFGSGAGFTYLGAATATTNLAVFLDKSKSKGYKALENTTSLLDAGDSFELTKSDTRLGIGNKVKDVAFIVSYVTDGELGERTAAPYGVFSFDNPVLGDPKAYFKPIYFQDANIGPEEEVVYKSGREGSVSVSNKLVDNIGSKVDIYFKADRVKRPGVEMTKDWNVTFDGELSGLESLPLNVSID